MICPIPLKYPDEFISNTKVVRNRSTSPDTPPSHVSDVHDTSGMIPSPPDTLSGNHPEPVPHPRMNSRSEQYTLYRIRASSTLCLTFVVFVLLLCCVFIVSSPPLF